MHGNSLSYLANPMRQASCEPLKIRIGYYSEYKMDAYVTRRARLITNTARRWSVDFVLEYMKKFIELREIHGGLFAATLETQPGSCVSSMWAQMREELPPGSWKIVWRGWASRPWGEPLRGLEARMTQASGDILSWERCYYRLNRVCSETHISAVSADKRCSLHLWGRFLDS